MTSDPSSAPPPSSPSLVQRIAVTVAAIAALLAARRLHLPLVEHEAFRATFGPLGWLDAVLSPVALGLTPFIGGFLLVELVALADPSLRPLRHAPAPRRARLTRAAWAVAAGLAALQGWGIATYLQALRTPYGFEVLEWGIVPRIVVAGTLVAGTLAAGALATLVSRQGLGNGFAVLFAVDAFGVLLRFTFRALTFSSGDPTSDWKDWPVLVALALAVVLPLVIARRGRERAGVPRIPFPTCGLAVVQAPALIVGFVAKAAIWVPAAVPLAEALAGRGWLLAAVDVAAAVVLAAWFARLFCPPRAVQDAFLRARAAHAGGVLDALRAVNLRSVAAAAAVALVPTAFALSGAPIAVGVAEVFALAILVAVARDLRGEAAFRRTAGALATALPVHRVYAVEPALEALAAAGIPAFPRALRYRTLFHFFAPWAPVEILVPAERAPEAEEICLRVVVTGAPPEAAPLPATGKPVAN